MSFQRVEFVLTYNVKSVPLIYLIEKWLDARKPVSMRKGSVSDQYDVFNDSGIFPIIAEISTQAWFSILYGKRHRTPGGRRAFLFFENGGPAQARLVNFQYQPAE
jgi:hypothetical protein